MKARGAMLLAVLSLACLQLSSAYTVNHRVLCVTLNSTTDYLDFVVVALQSYGIPYDILTLSTANADNFNYTQYLTSTTVDATGTPIGLYSGIFMYPNLEYYTVGGVNSGLTYTQLLQMREYMTGYGVRRVMFGVYPPALGASGAATDVINLADASNPGLGTELIATFNTTTVTASNASTGSGINFAGCNAQGISTDGLYKTPAAYAGLGTAHTPLMTFAANGTQFPTTSIAAVISTLPDYNGKSFKQMSYFFDCAAWNVNCLLINHLWVWWLTKEMLPGSRQVTLNSQFDDLLLTTQGINGTNEQIRIVPADLETHLSWVANVNSRLPAGSTYKLTIVINGNGALEVGMPDTASDIDDPPSIWNNDSWPKAFIKPNGTGTDMIYDWTNTKDSTQWTTGLNASSWNMATIKKEDALTNLITTNATIRSGFYWGHHTWSHEELDNTTYHDTNIQMTSNIAMLGPGYINMIGASGVTFATKAMVTPSISGLLNADAIRALNANGIVAAMGDSSYTWLINNVNPYQCLYTDLATFNHIGFPIIPRFATEVYYLVSYIYDEQIQYNIFYENYFGYNSTWPQILVREASRVTRAMLSLNHAAHMFHQANLNTNLPGDITYGYPWNGNVKKSYSLHQAWVEQVIWTYMQLVNWPVQSWDIDTLYASYVARKARDDCNFQYQFSVNNGTVSSVTASSMGAAGAACVAPLMMSSKATGTGITYTTIGNEYPISQCAFTAGKTCTFTLGSPVSWTS